MGPIIMLDKSVFQGLSRSELGTLRRYFKELLPPVLALEVLGDLSKETKRRSPEDVVRTLAWKFGGSGPTPCVDYRKAALGSLSGNEIPMTGQIPVDHGHTMRLPEGGTGVMIPLHPINHAIMRWVNGHFHDHDRAVSKLWREMGKSLSMRDIQKKVYRHRLIVPKVETIEDAVSTADSLLSQPGLQRVWVEWLLEGGVMQTPVTPTVQV